jgi:ribosomal protein S18 acetylase RimI-like enzyme
VTHDADSSVTATCDFERVVRGVDESAAREVAELFWNPFGMMLAGLALPKDREKSLDLLSHLFCLSEVYAALDSDGRLLGVAFVPGRARSICLQREAADRAFGRFGAWWRYRLFELVLGRSANSSYPKQKRSIEGFSVRPSCRGKGIGTKMLDRIIADARADGVTAIELNVGDNNPARHLYERSGFRQTRTQWVGPFSHRLGFRRFVYYELPLKKNAG